MIQDKFTKCKPGSFLDKMYREKFGQVYIDYVELEEDAVIRASTGPEFEFEDLDA